MKSFEGKQAGYAFQGPRALIDDILVEAKLKKIPGMVADRENAYPESEYRRSVSGKWVTKWATVQDRYFMSAVIPEKPENNYMRFYLSENGLLENQLIAPAARIEPGTEHVLRYRLYFGPKRISLLKEIGYDLDKTVNFGWFDILAKPCVWLLNFLYKYVPNYGVVIIILTVMIKIVLWPLGTISYKSMAQQKKIQPLMTEIREKYKNDRKKMNEEVMGLYRTYKINPFLGCFPMLVQIPIFFALYRMLYETVELRHAPFFGWINDLSAPDRLFHFGFPVPFMQDPDGIPVLTLIMGGLMFLQQKMQPPMGDPAQAKMFMLMPLFFTVIFINFSSGLVLYWLVNSVVSIAQQHYTTKKRA
jgi:YidC/Oxa1 family membrane protein insertase